MLTYSSDPLPQIVFPMDEDAIPPNSFCSAPPHHEPSPPLLPLSSTTPSCANDGNSGYRRSGRIQAQTPQKQSNTDRQALQRTPRQNQSHQKRLWVAESMVQASHSEQPKVESTHGHEKHNKEGFDFIAAAQGQNKQNDQGNPLKEPSVTAAENLEEQFADSTAHDLHTIKFPMDTSGGLAVGHGVENTSVPKGWVIGPLFQSLKSKMASLTEIVMTPVKLFRANSPPPSMDHPDKSDECVLKAEGEPSEPSDMFQPVAQSETGNQDITGKEEEIPQIAKYSKKLLFDVEMLTRRSEVAVECAVKEGSSPNSVHLQHSSFPCSKEEPVESSDLLQPYVDASASKESKLKIPSSMEDQEGKLDQLKPLPRVCIGNKRKGSTKTLASRLKKKSDMEVIDEQVSHLDLVNSNQAKSINNTSVSLTFSDCSEKDLPDGKSDDCRKMESCVMVRPNLRKSSNESVKGRKPKPTLASQLLDTETISAAGVGRAKRERKLDCYSEDIVKRKRLTEDKCTKRQELLNVASETGVLIGLRSSRKEVVFPNTFVDAEKKLKPPRKRPASSARANKVKVVQNEAEVKTQTECLSDVMSVCLVDESSGLAENTQKGSIIKVKPPASSKRVKTRTDLIESDGNLDSCMDLETTLAITEPKLSDTLVRPEIKQLQCTSRCRNIKGQPLKRKSPNQGGSITETDSTSVSASSPALLVEPVKLTPTDFNDSRGQKEERRKMEPKQPSKRLKMSLRGAIKSSASNENEETKQSNPSLQLITKGAQSLEGRNKILVDNVTEETPFESEPVPPLARPQLECYVHLDRLDEKRVNTSSEDVAKVHYSVVDEDFPTDTEASIHKSINVSRSLSRGVTIRPRRVDKQRTRCRVFHSRPNKGANVSNSITQDDADLATHSSDSGSSRSLLRSYSCPEILSLRHHDTPWTSSMHSPHLSRIHTSNQHHTPLVYHTHKAQRRARRHTVCSLEVEREIAPLCLRKEVYPSRRSLPYDSSTQHLPPSLALSPTTSLTALASCFLSSPLAFLSKKFDSRPATSPSTSSHVSSPTASASVYPLSPSTWRLPGFLQRTESNCGTSDSSRSADPLECEIERIQQSEEEDDGGDTSSSSQEFEDAALREEKSLSDSEIKVVKKHEERGKVSSIRIRKTLPKAQNNLTPMGLPKPVRLKKKEFSLEEIYTNKNFIQPPESRLETIFEVPLNRRNGSESWFGQRRLKRFLEFLEVGEARKPKKPLVGVGKANNSTSRTRRGGFPKDEPSLSMQDVDSLLCAKLDQLNLWLIHDQRDS